MDTDTGYFIDHCEVDKVARYVAVKAKGGSMVHEATYYRSLEAIAKAGIKAEFVEGRVPWGEQD